MPVDLSIKRVPEELAKRLRRRAASHHRSLQGEPLTLAQALDWTRAAELRTLAAPVETIREDRERYYLVKRKSEVKVVDSSAPMVIADQECHQARV